MAMKCDESPQISVARCLLAASREMKMLNDIRSVFKSLFRRGNDLDSMFVADVTMLALLLDGPKEVEAKTSGATIFGSLP